MAIPVQSYRKWKRVFIKGGARFTRVDGKNHHIWAYTPKGQTKGVTFSFVAHGDGADINPVYIAKAWFVWKLRKEDGVSDHDFCKGHWRKEG